MTTYLSMHRVQVSTPSVDPSYEPSRVLPTGTAVTSCAAAGAPSMFPRPLLPSRPGRPNFRGTPNNSVAIPFSKKGLCILLRALPRPRPSKLAPTLTSFAPP